MVVTKNLILAKQANKVVAMSSTSVTAQPLDHQRAMTKDERRIITMQLDDVHNGDSYIADWCDEKVAKHLSYPRNWVSKVREDYFGPDINEQMSVLNDAEALVAEMKREKEARIKCDEALWVRLAQIETAIAKLKN